MAARTSSARSPLRSADRMGARTTFALVAVTLGAVVAIGVPAPAHADEEDFTFESFHADMTLTRAADEHAELTVTETIVARFPEDEEQNRGIIRAIPDDYDGVPLRTDVISVTDADGDSVPFELSEDDGFLEVATGTDAYVFGEQTYVISYTQRDTIRAFDDTDADEFQRDINGTGWEQPFGEVSATLTLDADLASELTGEAACYRGEEGSGDECDVERNEADGATVFSVAESGLEPEQNVSLVVGFERGTFVPGQIERNAFERFAFAATPVVQGGSIAAIVLSALAAIGAVLAHRRARDAPGRGVIVPEYEPPREVTVMQAAHLAGRPAAAVPAALVDLAVAGHVRFLVREGDETPDGVTLELVRTSEDAERQDVLVAVFGEDSAPGAQKTVTAESHALAKRLSDLSDVAKDSLRAAGLTEARRQRGLSLAIYAVMGVFLFSLVCLLLAVVGRTATWLGPIGLVASIAAGAVAFSLWRYRDRVTDAGALVRDHLHGLREYLALAEEDRLRVLQSPAGAQRIDTGDPLQIVHLYEELLPYAVLWGGSRRTGPRCSGCACARRTRPSGGTAARPSPRCISSRRSARSSRIPSARPRGRVRAEAASRAARWVEASRGWDPAEAEAAGASGEPGARVRRKVVRGRLLGAEGARYAWRPRAGVALSGGQAGKSSGQPCSTR